MEWDTRKRSCQRQKSGYNSRPRVGAARCLPPGVNVPWDKESDTAFVDIVQEQGRIAADLGAMILLAVDVRWVAKRQDLVAETLRSTDQAVALVLAHRADPLSASGAIPGLRRVASMVDRLFLLRSDHGAIGALVFWGRTCLDWPHNHNPPLRDSGNAASAPPRIISTALCSPATRLVSGERYLGLDRCWQQCAVLALLLRWGFT